MTLGLNSRYITRMKTFIISTLALLSMNSFANYNDVTCSTADQSILFQGDDHSHVFVVTDSSGNKETFTKHEMKINVPGEWISISKTTVQIDCDQELGIARFNVLEDYVIHAELLRVSTQEVLKATMLCHRTKRTQGPCLKNQR